MEDWLGKGAVEDSDFPREGARHAPALMELDVSQRHMIAWSTSRDEMGLTEIRVAPAAELASGATAPAQTCLASGPGCLRQLALGVRG